MGFIPSGGESCPVFGRESISPAPGRLVGVGGRNGGRRGSSNRVLAWTMKRVIHAIDPLITYK